MSQLDRFIDTFLNLQVALRYYPDLLQGALVTLAASVAIVLTGLALGALLAGVRALAPAPVRWLIVGYADILRAVPPLLVIMLLFFALPQLGWSLGAFAATWLALSLVLAAYTEEVFWSALLAVPNGQWEAARATGLDRTQTLLHVIAPQSLRMTIAPLTNRVISISKSTALGSVVAMPDVISRAGSALSNSANATPLVMTAVIYLLMYLPFISVARRIEARFAGVRA